MSLADVRGQKAEVGQEGGSAPFFGSRIIEIVECFTEIDGGLFRLGLRIPFPTR